jgi:hypothetical protein
MQMTNLINVELNEKNFRVDYQKNLSQAFVAMRQIQMDLKWESTKELVEELSRVDKMQSDVLHIIEFLNFNASEGFKFSKMLQVIRKARRKIKNRMEERDSMKALVQVYEQAFKGELEKSIKDTEKLIQIQNNRSYRLRELTELEGFNEVIKKQKEKMAI